MRSFRLHPGARRVVIGAVTLLMVFMPTVRQTVAQPAACPVPRGANHSRRVFPSDRDDAISAAALLRRLDGLRRERLTRDDRALRAGLAFCAAVRRARGQAAFPLVEAIGYQPLPLSGPLPISPGRPVRPEVLARLIDKRKAGAFDFPAECFRVVDKKTLRREFPAVARWMLPGDRALVVAPPPTPAADWVGRRCCLVIRVRGSQATIIGGNLFAALRAPSRAAETR